MITSNCSGALVSGTAPLCSMRARTSATFHRLRDILRIRISRANAERGYRISKTATDLGNIGMIGQEQASAAKIAFACASPFAFRIWPFAHGDLDDVAQRRRVAEHLVQDTDAFGDAEIEAGNGTRVGGRIEKAFSLGTPQHDVHGTFDAGGSLGDDAKHFVRRVWELERRIGVETTARSARFAHLRYQGLEKSFNRTIGVRIRQLLDSLLAHRRFIAFERRHEEALLVAERVVEASAAKSCGLFQILDGRPSIALAPKEHHGPVDNRAMIELLGACHSVAFCVSLPAPTTRLP